MRLITLLLGSWLLAACSLQSYSGSNDSEAQLQRLSFISALDQSERQFFVYLPKGYHSNAEKDWPLLMFLHGNGERGNGLSELDYVLTHGPLYEAWIQKRELPFVLIVPQLPMFGMEAHADYLRNRDPSQIPQRLAEGVPPRPADFPTPEPMNGVPAPTSMDITPAVLPNGWDRIEEDLVMMLDRVEAEYRIDKQKVYLSGLSYGGFGTWYLASQHPERFAAISPVVGWGHPKLMAPIAEHQIPVWAFAAGRDPVVPIEYFYPGLNTLEALGHPEVRFTNHEDMGHDAWTRVYQSEDLYRWLLEQSQQDKPSP